MSNDPDQIREDIEFTRNNLRRDVDALTETATPGAVARHQAHKVTGAAGRLKDRVMGSADDLTSAGSSAASSAQDAAGSAPSAVRHRTQGNPLAAGAVAVAVGWLVGSLLPASQKETEASAALKAKAAPLAQEAGAAAQDVGQHLKEPAQDAVEAVKSTATDAAVTVKGEASSATSDVTEDAKGSAQTVRQTAAGPSNPGRSGT
jgi:ElaB/YqjD/DUF883 family membrane-anchored ribosome-binding protein